MPREVPESGGQPDRVALVTGAAKGIGAAIAARLAQDGLLLSLVDLDGTGAQRTADGLAQTAGEPLVVKADVGSPGEVAAAVETIVASLGRIDVLVNCAGIAGSAAPIEQQPLEAWEKMLKVNLGSVFYFCRAVIPQMKTQGTGRIINIASISGKEGNPNMVPYSTAKAGVIGLTKAVAKEVAREGIMVNSVAPAVIATEILDQLTDEQVNYMVERIPMGRTGQPEEVAALVSWLASPECSFSTGFCYDISGGRATY